MRNLSLLQISAKIAAPYSRRPWRPFASRLGNLDRECLSTRVRRAARKAGRDAVTGLAYSSTHYQGPGRSSPAEFRRRCHINCRVGFGGPFRQHEPIALSYKRHRFPPQIIAHAVWLYFRFPLSLRLVEEMLLERGIVLSYETIRRRAMKFGPDYARRLFARSSSALLSRWLRTCRSH